MQSTLRDHCMENGLEGLLSEWDRDRNNPLTPDGVAFGSHRKVWWRCDKGHAWRAQVKSRVQGCGCPVCAGRQVLPGVNDLATANPALAGQWHPTKNAGLTPRDVTPGSRRKVWWRCEKGHEWLAQPYTRSQGCGCPVCTGKTVLPGENDLAGCAPEVAGEWHPTLNGALTPQAVTSQSNRKVWWMCSRGHAWQAQISARVARRSGCPYCTGRKVLPGFNDLATLEPELARQWHPDLNGPLTPGDVTTGTRRKVWWECGQGHVWKAAVCSRTAPRSCGCPVCAGRVRQSNTARYAALSRVDLYSGKNFL